MHCGVETLNERSPNRTGLRVNFSDKGEVKERREKFLTAKYGSHQMSLIRKRLAVEMWLYDELQKLFDPPVSINRCLSSSPPAPLNQFAASLDSVSLKYSIAGDTR